MSLDEEQVQLESKEYDLECVQWLSVEGQDIRDISVLQLCPNLIELDISHNRILSLHGLEGLGHLRVLNAAYNKVTDLSKLEGCMKLEKLLVQGNEFFSLDTLPPLPCLRQFTLRDGDASNPIYENSNFAPDENAAELALLKLLKQEWPSVVIFNGSHTTFAKSAAEVLLDLAGPNLSDIEGINANSSQDWLTGFEWGEYFVPEQFSKSYEASLDGIENMIAEIKEIDTKNEAVLKIIGTK